MFRRSELAPGDVVVRVDGAQDEHIGVARDVDVAAGLVLVQDSCVALFRFFFIFVVVCA